MDRLTTTLNGLDDAAATVFWIGWAQYVIVCWLAALIFWLEGPHRFGGLMDEPR